MNLTFTQHRYQAAQFIGYSGKRGGDWAENFRFWADSKDFDMADYIAIKTLVLETLTSQGVAPSELGEVA
jgi:hypothetical protein